MRAKVASNSPDSPDSPGGGCPALARVSSQVPFFRVLEGERRLDVFPFGLHRKSPFLGRFWALSAGASMDGLARTGGRFVPPAQG